MLPDFFLDFDPDELRQQMKDQGGTPAFGEGAPGGGAGPQATFDQIQAMLGEDLVGSVGGVFQFKLTGEENF